MRVFRTIEETRSFSKRERLEGRRVGLVPTMGALHEGHLSLVDLAKNHADDVVVSIFVNPTQFGAGEDLGAYPRRFVEDCRLCESRGVDAVFAPSADEMYPEEQTCWVDEKRLSRGLCGASRPGHFRGVASVVTKLFNIALPDVAVFGQKDAQQVAVIRKMVADLNVPVDIVVGSIVREPDGLAMSSRNKYLSSDERRRAVAIHQALTEARRDVEGNKELRTAPLIKSITERLRAAGGDVDYVKIVDPVTLRSSRKINGQALALVAAYFGKARLIDNMTLKVSC